MHKGSELYIVHQNNKPKVLVEESILKFREDQDFSAEYLVAYTESESSALLLKKLKSHKYKVVTFTNGKGDSSLTLLSIRNFVDGISDVYWINNTLYDRHHNKLLKTCKAILDEVTILTFIKSPLIQLKNDIYVSIGLIGSSTIVLLSPKKNVLFTSVKYIDPKVNLTCSTSDEVFYIDKYAFADLNIDALLAKLKQQNTIDEMKEKILKELAFNSI